MAAALAGSERTLSRLHNVLNGMTDAGPKSDTEGELGTDGSITISKDADDVGLQRSGDVIRTCRCCCLLLARAHAGEVLINWEFRLHHHPIRNVLRRQRVQPGPRFVTVVLVHLHSQ